MLSLLLFARMLCSVACLVLPRERGSWLPPSRARGRLARCTCTGPGSLQSSCVFTPGGQGAGVCRRGSTQLAERRQKPHTARRTWRGGTPVQQRRARPLQPAGSNVNSKATGGSHGAAHPAPYQLCGLLKVDELQLLHSLARHAGLVPALPCSHDERGAGSAACHQTSELGVLGGKCIVHRRPPSLLLPWSSQAHDHVASGLHHTWQDVPPPRRGGAPCQGPWRADVDV